MSDVREIEKCVHQVIKSHPEEVRNYLAGDQKIFKFLMGQAMGNMKGKSNPRLMSDILKKTLAQMNI